MKQDSAFTLIELLVVTTIILIVGFVSFSSIQSQVHYSFAMQELQTLKNTVSSLENRLGNDFFHYEALILSGTHYIIKTSSEMQAFPPFTLAGNKASTQCGNEEDTKRICSLIINGKWKNSFQGPIEFFLTPTDSYTLLMNYEGKNRITFSLLPYSTKDENLFLLALHDATHTYTSATIQNSIGKRKTIYLGNTIVNTFSGTFLYKHETIPYIFDLQ